MDMQGPKLLVQWRGTCKAVKRVEEETKAILYIGDNEPVVAQYCGVVAGL